MSSRNVYLDAEQRKIAAQLNVILHQLANHRASAEVAEAEAKRALLEAGFTEVEYACIRDAETLGVPDANTRARRALIVARLGETRLLDNSPAV
jgi:pantoate--beta-alanine ligase